MQLCASECHCEAISSRIQIIQLKTLISTVHHHLQFLRKDEIAIYTRGSMWLIATDSAIDVNF